MLLGWEAASSPASLLYSTYLGGDWLDVGSGIATDGAGKAYIAGGTLSLNFPLFHHFQPDTGDSNQDAWVTVLDLSALPRSLSGFTATPTTAELAPVHLAWIDEADNEQNIEIQRMPAGQMWTSTLLPPNTISWDDTNVMPGVTYKYRGRAINSDGVSPWSDEVTVTALAGVPNAPSNLSVTASMPNRLELAWTDHSMVEAGFRVEGKLNGGDFAEIGQAGANATTFTHMGLNPSATWTYRVRAVVDMRASDPSNEASGTTLPAPPTAPGKLTAKALSKSLIALSWTDSTGETEYRLERKAGEKAFTQIATPASGSTGYFDTTVVEKTTYVYRLRAANTGGVSNYSNEATVKTPKTYSKGRLEVRPTEIEFKGIAPGSSATAKLTVRNIGKQTLKVVFAQPAAPFTLEGAVSFNLKPKAKRTLRVRYTAPQNGKGAQTVLLVADSGKSDPVIEVPLRGL